MNFKCQEEPLAQLHLLADIRRQSILIDGASGCGKSYLARQYSALVDVPDFQTILPKVDDIRTAVETCLNLSEPVVLCIENLDCGVPAASYALLKFLEEPLPNVYIIVTCRNLQGVPDTIVSRCTVVNVAPPITSDISEYSASRNLTAFNRLKSRRIWNCVRTFSDADTVMSLTDAQLSYFESLEAITKFSDSVSNIMWKLGHYDDNSESPAELVVRYLMDVINTPYVQQCGISCIRDLSQGRIASHAVLAKFVFNVKYCE